MERFIKVFITSSILFAIPFFFLGRWSLSISVRLGAIIIFGLIVASIALLLTRFIKFSYRNFAIIMVLMIISGAIITCSLYIVLYFWPSGQWKKIETPLEKPVALVGYSNFSYLSETIYIRSDKNNIYAYECDYKKPSVWKKLETIPNEPKCGNHQCQENYKPFRTPRAPGKIIDFLDVFITGADSSRQIDYILLEDGSIWVWDRMTSSFDVFLFEFAIVKGLIIGLFLSFILLVKRRSKVGW